MYSLLQLGSDSFLSGVAWLEQIWAGHSVGLVLNKPIIELSIVLTCLILAFWRLSQIKAARPLLKVFTLLGLAYFGARFVGFELLARMLEFGFVIGILGFIVLFQPELRRLASPSGPVNWSTRLPSAPIEMTVNKSHLAHELLETVRILSKRKIGALIVYETDLENKNAYLEIGTPINARLSSELLLTIFHPNTPLHDGAVIIRPEGFIVSAGVLLPLSENRKLSWEYGTRHRAAVGLTEVSSNVCIVVSEETGRISLAQNGQIIRLQEKEALEAAISNMIGPSGEGEEADARPASSQGLGNLFSAEFFQRFFVSKS